VLDCLGVAKRGAEVKKVKKRCSKVRKYTESYSRALATFQSNGTAGKQEAI